MPVLKVAMYQPQVNRNSQCIEPMTDRKYAVIPEDCLTKDDYLYIAVYGYDTDGTLRKTSDYVYVYVHDGTPSNY